VFMGTANPFFGTQLWRMYSDRDQSIEDEPVDDTHNCPSAHFVDLDFDNWYHESVDYVVENGLMRGYNEDHFAPNASTTRAMIAMMLYRIAGCPEVTAENTFSDVSEGKWYYDAVIWASENGIVNGYGDGTFGPDNTINREQMVCMLHRYAVLMGLDTGVRGDLSHFIDLERTSDFAMDSMSWAVGTGLIEGYTEGHISIVNSWGDALRSQVAALMMRLCENVLN